MENVLHDEVMDRSENEAEDRPVDNNDVIYVPVTHSYGSLNFKNARTCCAFSTQRRKVVGTKVVGSGRRTKVPPLASSFVTIYHPRE